MTELNDSRKIECLKKYPQVKRAKGSRLYSYNNTRYLDLYLDSGKAYTGHRTGRLQLTLKDIISRGVLADYPSVYIGRALKALEFYDKTYLKAGFSSFILFPNEAVAVRELSKAKIISTDSFPTCIFLHSGKKQDPLLLLPETTSSSCEIAIICVPFPGSMTPCAVGLRGNAAIEAETAHFFETVCPPAAGAFSRAVYDLCDYLKSETKQTAEIKSPCFNQNGRYMIYSGNIKNYNDIFDVFLQSKVLLPPSPDFPVILPSEYSDGEFELLRSLFGSVKG